MSFARIIVMTQECENRGSEEQPDWREKGGTDYCVAVIDPAEAEKDDSHLEATYVDTVRDAVSFHGPLFQRYVIGWELLREGELTGFEKSQARYDGRIDFPAHGIGAGGAGPWCPVSARDYIQATKALRDREEAERYADFMDEAA